MRTYFRKAPVTAVFILLCVAVFMIELNDPQSIGQYFLSGAAIVHFSHPSTYYHLLTYTFAHASLTHIGFDLLLLGLFGFFFEPNIKSIHLIALIVTASIIIGVADALLCNDLILGSSGIFCAYLALGLYVYVPRKNEAYIVFGGAYLILQLILGFDVIFGFSHGGRVAYQVHAIGILVGLAYGYLFKKRGLFKLPVL